MLVQDFEGSKEDAASSEPVPPHASPVGGEEQKPKAKQGDSRSFEPEGWQPGKQ